MAANTPPLILVVDDSEPGRYVAVRTLRNAGFRVIEAATGGEALALADTLYLEPTEHADEQIKRLRLLGTASLGKGDIDRAKVHLAALESLQKETQAAKHQAGEEAVAKAKEMERQFANRLRAAFAPTEPAP